MFQITRGCESQYFASPTQEYFDKNGNDFINKVCPKYSHGKKNSFATCFIHISKEIVQLSEWCNYVAEYYIYKCKSLKKYEYPYKGLGLILLKSIIVDELNKQNIDSTTDFIIYSVTKSNTKLVNYYKSLSFAICNDNEMYVNMKSSVIQFLNSVTNIETILPNY